MKRSLNTGNRINNLKYTIFKSHRDVFFWLTVFVKGGVLEKQLDVMCGDITAGRVHNAEQVKELRRSPCIKTLICILP